MTGRERSSITGREWVWCIVRTLLA